MSIRIDKDWLNIDKYWLIAPWAIFSQFMFPKYLQSMKI